MQFDLTILAVGLSGYGGDERGVADLVLGDGRWQPARVPVMVLACSRMVPGRQNEGVTGGRSSIWARAAARCCN
jgi:hypothetical protein